MSNLAVTDLVALVGAIEHSKGKHVKAMLAALERIGALDANTRKIILDGFNDHNRQVLRLLGYSVEK